MPRQISAIPDDVVLRELDALSPSICVTAAQASMVLGVSESQLEERRRAGTPPPFVSDSELRGKIRYRIGDLRSQIAENTYRSTAAARAAIERRQAGLGFATFSDFLAQGTTEDEWPFTLVGARRRPIDFFRSLGMTLDDDAECVWLSLPTYATALALAVNGEHADEVRAALELALPAQPTETCPRCHRPLGPGHRCRIL